MLAHGQPRNDVENSDSGVEAERHGTSVITERFSVNFRGSARLKFSVRQRHLLRLGGVS